jgi:hypothetical protein
VESLNGAGISIDGTHGAPHSMVAPRRCSEGSKDSCPSLTAAVRTLRLLGLFAHSYFLLPYFGIKYDFFREVTGTFE